MIRSPWCRSERRGKENAGLRGEEKSLEGLSRSITATGTHSLIGMMHAFLTVLSIPILDTQERCSVRTQL